MVATGRENELEAHPQPPSLLQLHDSSIHLLHQLGIQEPLSERDGYVKGQDALWKYVEFAAAILIANRNQLRGIRDDCLVVSLQELLCEPLVVPAYST